MLDLNTVEDSTTQKDVRAYALAIVTSAAAVAVTRFTWPFFEGTPLLPMFSAVALATHFGSGPAGLVALVLTVLGSRLAFPVGDPAQFDLRSLVTFVVVGVLANRILDGRKRSAASLQKSEAEFRAVWEHAALGAALLNTRGTIERINPALERLLGAPAAAYAGVAFAACSHPDEEAAERDRLARLMAGDEAFYQREQQYRRNDGSFFWGRVTVSSIRAGKAAPTGALAIVEDITARRQGEMDLRASEERLRRAQKTEAVGQLVAGVAHNFNNLLTVTMGYTDLLLERQGEHGPDHDELEEIRKATARGASLTRQLLAFGREHQSMPMRLDLNEVILRVRDMLSRVIREDIELRIGVQPAPAMLQIDPHDLEQVILNLVINARDALPIGGVIDIDVRRQTIDEKDLAPGEYVRLRVHDNGMGMTPEVREHLFEPFFTTKEVGSGTGLGLAFVDGIVRHAKGFVTVDTAPGMGTAFSVYFPLAEAAPVADAVAAPAASGARKPSGATILLVEDEAAVREMTTQMLGRAGYRVLAAATPSEATSLFDAHAADIDLLLTDIVMPEMHGPVLAQRLVARRPELRVVFVSGHSDAMPAGATATGKTAFLGKPFAAAHLLATLTEVLNAA